MAGHPGTSVSTTLGIVSAFLPAPIRERHGRRSWSLNRRLVRRWLGFCCLLSIMGLRSQLAPQRSDDPHAVFALKDRNEFVLLGRESDHVFCRV